MYIVTFTVCQLKNASDPHIFWAEDATVSVIILMHFLLILIRFKTRLVRWLRFPINSLFLFEFGSFFQLIFSFRIRVGLGCQTGP